MSKITLDNLSDNLKDYLNTLGLTQGQVQGLIEAELIDVQQFKLTDDNGCSQVISSGSINDITLTGFYRLTDAVTDCPMYNEGYRGWYHLEVIASDSNWVKQTCTIFEANGYGTRMWIRGKQNGVWAPWREFADSGAQLVKMSDNNGYCKGIPNNDANQIPTTGMWMGMDVVNGPANVYGQWIYIEALVHNNAYQFQRATCLHDCTIEWVRHQNSGQWSPWRSL